MCCVCVCVCVTVDEYTEEEGTDGSYLWKLLGIIIP